MVMGIDAYNAQLLASLPDGHPLKSQLAPASPDQLAKLQQFAVSPPPPSVMGSHDSPALPGLQPTGAPSALASAPLPASAFQAPRPNPTIVMPEQVISAPAERSPTPAPRPPNGPQLFNTGASSAREVQTRGPTQARLLERSYQELENAAGSTRDASKKLALMDAMNASARQDDAAQQMADSAAARAKYVQRAEAIQRDIQRSSQELAKGPDAVQVPDGQRALGAIAVALGAGGAALTGTQNFAQQIWDKALERAAAQKRAEWEAKRSSLAGKQDAFGNLVQQYGMSGAESIYKAAAADKLAAQAEQMAASKGITQADAVYQETVGKLHAQADRERAAGVTYTQAHQGQNMVFDQDLGVAVPYEEWVKDALGRRRDAEKARAEGKDAVQGEVSELAKRREQAGLPRGEAMLSRAETDLAKAPQISKGKASLAAFVEGSKFLPEVIKQAGMSALYNKDEAAREQSHQAVVNQYINDVTGSGGGDVEMRRIQKAAGEAKVDPEARKRFYANMAEWYREREKNIRAGVSPQARARFDAALESESAPAIQEKPF